MPDRTRTRAEIVDEYHDACLRFYLAEKELEKARAQCRKLQAELEAVDAR